MGSDRSLLPTGQFLSTRILHVEDDPATREQVRRVLSLEHQVVSASGLTEALDLARSHCFSLYLLGGMFRDGSSLELCYELRLLDPNVPVLFHSLLPKDLTRPLLLAGATEILDRTDPADSFTDAVRRHVDGVSESPQRRSASFGG